MVVLGQGLPEGRGLMGIGPSKTNGRGLCIALRSTSKEPCTTSRIFGKGGLF